MRHILHVHAIVALKKHTRLCPIYVSKEQTPPYCHRQDLLYCINSPRPPSPGTNYSFLESICMRTRTDTRYRVLVVYCRVCNTYVRCDIYCACIHNIAPYICRVYLQVFLAFLGVSRGSSVPFFRPTDPCQSPYFLFRTLPFKCPFPSVPPSSTPSSIFSKARHQILLLFVSFFSSFHSASSSRLSLPATIYRLVILFFSTLYYCAFISIPFSS